MIGEHVYQGTRTFLQVVGEYSFALDVLDDYDHERLPPTLPATGPAKGIDYDEALRIVRVRTPQPLLNVLIASAGGPFPSATEAVHGTWCGSKEAGRVAAAAISL
jgi:hypothetical protein